MAASAEGDGDPVDVVLCPVGPGVAPPLNCARYWGYTAQWNLCDYPALVFPTGLSVVPDVDAVEGGANGYESGYQPRNKGDEYNYKLCKSLFSDNEVSSSRGVC